MDKFFDVIVSNPPYQVKAQGDNKNSLLPIYHNFMDIAENISKNYIFITPSRWLFNTGKTPVKWNEKMLNDPSIQVYYYPEKAKIFNNVQIRGGIVITNRIDKRKDLGLNGTFIHIPEMKKILQKVLNKNLENSNISQCILSGHKIIKKIDQQLLKNLYPYKNIEKIDISFLNGEIESNVFIRYPELFLTEDFIQEKNLNIDDFYKIYGLKNLKRTYRYVNKQIIRNEDENFIKSYNVLYPKSSGSGTFGEKLAPFQIAKKQEIHTKSFISIGSFDTEEECKNCIKYLNSSFARSLLFLLKPTHQNSKKVWRFIPMQDFTNNNKKINWNENIDKQLYKLYDLNKEEIEFLNTSIRK